MSNPTIFKSNEAAATQASMALKKVGMEGTYMTTLAQGSTNLTVVRNMVACNTILNKCHSDFLQLLSNDADSIEQVEKAFDEFDQQEANMMQGWK